MPVRPLALLLVMAVACSSDPASVTATTTSPTTTLPTTTSTEAEFEADEVPSLALYLATIDAGLEGTDLEGLAFEDAEALIDTGVVFCDLLEEGLEPRDVMRGWVAALTSAGDREPTEDEYTLGGVILGASVRFICPEFLDAMDL